MDVRYCYGNFITDEHYQICFEADKLAKELLLRRYAEEWLPIRRYLLEEGHDISKLPEEIEFLSHLYIAEMKLVDLLDPECPSDT